ncbi:MAG: methyltransferase domain-containing protein [Myxococcaceae bacterium]|jgi:SAM-dependent methyltransferase|nr:methyltransferase domain-containing protein [Myxococcaceae bacterium]MCA3015355.1 methyltransferase domain-containing protein [Myxococcaceae bacterium]
MFALLLGRFHAVTKAQAAWLERLASEPVERLVCVITSANHAGTRRNPLDVVTREAMLVPALARTGRPFDVVRIDDVPDSEAWVAHVLRQVQAQAGLHLEPGMTRVYSANRDVDALFSAQGFTVVSSQVRGLTPHELVQRVVDGRPWRDEASPETVSVYERAGLVDQLRGVFHQKLLNDDGELGHLRDFGSYGAQMDASLRQKLAELVRWITPGHVVDKGCGTGKLLVELSRLLPGSRFSGVDLSREFLRVCDENTYATDDVSLVFGNVVDVCVPAGSATTVIFSSVMHEVHSYSGYDPTQIDRALSNAHVELATGGRVLIRDGLSPEPATWRLELLTPQTRETFVRFSREFRQGRGVTCRYVSDDVVELSSHDANEFLCKKDYLKNWHIEVHEEFGPLTLAQWGEALRRAGFTPLHLEATHNPWIITNRYAGTVRLTDVAGQPLPWPATNGIVVGQTG